MQGFQIACGVTLAMFAQAAYALDRPSVAVRLFEDVCLPIVSGVLPAAVSSTDGQKQFSDGDHTSTRWFWSHLPSGFSVEVLDYLDGRLRCEITDKSNEMSKSERETFEKQVSEWMANKMPMLAHETPEPLESFEYFETWMDPRFGKNDQRRWGALHWRFNGEFGHTTSLILAYTRERPTS
ncbi:MAG: hypothetical protein JXR15_01195 [Shimia sp.]|uniref:hypothetical protein n=1 Tax=Shimia sp. TaxID=1954381 RepID=UPI003B8B6183